MIAATMHGNICITKRSPIIEYISSYFLLFLFIVCCVAQQLTDHLMI